MEVFYLRDRQCRLQGIVGFREQHWSGALGLGNFHAAGLSTGSPTGQDIWKTSTQFMVRTLEVCWCCTG